MIASAQRKTPSVPAPEVYDAASYEPRKAVGYLVNRLREEMSAALERRFAAHPELAALELSWPQFRIIATIATDSEAKSASSLCKSVSYDAGAMTRMVDRLQSKGLVRRERCPNDRRLQYLELTEAGRGVWPIMMEITRQALNSLLRGFTKAEARQLEGFLRRMLENV
ncbi:MAG: MarR family winged helix-turn-helix transcriptional regulator [Steroidobacteraceae bacterium]